MKTRRKSAGGRFRIVAALFLLLTLGMLYTGDRMLSWGAFCCLALLCGAGLWHMVTASMMTVSARVDDGNPIKGQKACLTLTVRNRSPFPVLWMALSCKTIDAVFLGVEPSLSLSMPPFGHRTISIDMSCLYKGSYDVGVAGMTLHDPLGFLSLQPRARGGPILGMTVWPRRVTVPESADSQAVLEEKTAPKRDYSEDLSSIHEIRDWQDGDALKRVHWKLTARMGALMIKEFDSTTRDEISIILDARPWDGTLRDRMKYEDALIESAYSISAELLEFGHPLRLTTQTDDIVHLRGVDSADIPRFYTFLSSMPLAGTHSADEIIEFEAPMLNRGGRMIVIGGFPDDDLLASLTALADEGISITLVITVPHAVSRPLSVDRSHRLSQSGIRCMVADPDQGLSLVGAGGGMAAASGDPS